MSKIGKLPKMNQVQSNLGFYQTTEYVNNSISNKLLMKINKM